jgi:uncharacterized protein YpmB
MLALFLIIMMACYVLLAIYLIYAHSSEPKKWPFHTKEKVNQVDHESGDGSVFTVVHSKPLSNGDTIGSVFIIIFLIIFFALFIVGMYWSLKTSMKRYDIADDAIKKGHAGVAVAALSPEIGEGIGAAVSGLWGNNR